MDLKGCNDIVHIFNSLLLINVNESLGFTVADPENPLGGGGPQLYVAEGHQHPLTEHGRCPSLDLVYIH